MRVALGLSAFTWTDPLLTVGSTSVQAVHVTEMRTALHDAFAAAGRTEPPYMDPLLSSDAVIKAMHITELRQAVWQLE